MKRLLIIVITILFMCSNLNAAQNDNALILSGLNQFSFDLFNKVNSANQNIIISPYSLSSLLEILTIGAADNTRSQLLNVLHITGLQNTNHLINSFNPSDPSTLIANALWAKKTFNFKQSFLKLINQSQSAQFHQIDFSNPEQARTIINRWVAQSTRNMIQNLFPKGSISNSARLILTNAIYFKGLWQSPFKVESTQQKPFTLTNGNTSSVSMMQQHHKFLYTENNSLQMLILSYAKSRIAMAVLLPKSGHTLQSLQSSLNNAAFVQLVQNAIQNDIIVSMPKFELSSTFNNLAESMQALGLTDAFTAKANFSNMTSDPLLISSIIQKAIVKVDEKGTVAAAASGINMIAAVQMQPKPPIIFNANHPFIFILFDNKTNLILFIGQVTNPT